MPKQKPNTVSLNVTYPANLFSASLDERIEAAVGQDAEASGCGFGERDMQWYGMKRGAAQQAMQRIKSKVKIKGLTVEIVEDSEDW